jgi:pyridinium-3,5-biscarboxylic acid mononucleotide synthase
MDDVVLDHHRAARTGVPEVVLGEWKTAAQIAAALTGLVARAEGAGALATRVAASVAAEVVAQVPGAEYLEVARIVRVAGTRARAVAGKVAVVAAGTSDLPVVEEAVVTAEFIGVEVERVVDVGVAGVHRLLERIERIRTADAVIVVAGMEGALPSVVAGLIDRPLVAVPTSVGYGVGAGGLVALGTMLSSCAPGVSVVNIDNGFGAAVIAARFARELAAARAGQR